MASWTQWTRFCANSGRWWYTGKPGVLQSMGSPRLRHDFATEQQKRATGCAERKAWLGAGTEGPPVPHRLLTWMGHVAHTLVLDFKRPSLSPGWRLWGDSWPPRNLPGSHSDMENSVLLCRSSWPLSGWLDSISWPAQRQGYSGDNRPLVNLSAELCLQCVLLATGPPLSTPQRPTDQGIWCQLVPSP